MREGAFIKAAAVNNKRDFYALILTKTKCGTVLLFINVVCKSLAVTLNKINGGFG